MRRMFDGIRPNDRFLRSRFDQGQMISFQMSLPSDILGTFPESLLVFAPNLCFLPPIVAHFPKLVIDWL